LIDLQPPGRQRAPLVTSTFSSLGLALGSLVTSVLVQYGPAPTRLIWWILLAVFAVSIAAMPFIAEPGSRRPGVLGALKPRVAVPRAARASYLAVLPSLIAIWALGGLFLSLGPSLAAEATGSSNLLPGGLVIFALFGAGAAAAYLLRSIGSRAGLLAGCLLLIIGMALTFTAIATTAAALFYLGTAVGGFGFGLVSLGSFRLIPARVEPGQRAGVVAAIYIAGYLAFSIPALVAGETTTRFGLHPTALVYAVAVAVLAAAAGVILLLRPDEGQSQPAAADRVAVPDEAAT
jgi:hypothetical protein